MTFLDKKNGANSNITFKTELKNQQRALANHVARAHMNISWNIFEYLTRYESMQRLRSRMSVGKRSLGCCG